VRILTWFACSTGLLGWQETGAPTGNDKDFQRPGLQTAAMKFRLNDLTACCLYRKTVSLLGFAAGRVIKAKFAVFKQAE
jgi:hypothetical protein